MTFWQSLGFGELTGAKDPLSKRVTCLFPSPAEGVNADNNSNELNIFTINGFGSGSMKDCRMHVSVIVPYNVQFVKPKHPKIKTANICPRASSLARVKSSVYGVGLDLSLATLLPPRLLSVLIFKCCCRFSQEPSSRKRTTSTPQSRCSSPPTSRCTYLPAWPPRPGVCPPPCRPPSVESPRTAPLTSAPSRASSTGRMNRNPLTVSTSVYGLCVLLQVGYKCAPSSVTYVDPETVHNTEREREREIIYLRG